MSPPMRLRIRSAWLPDNMSKDIVLPDPTLKELFKIERHWELNLLRIRWGHTTYILKVNKEDKLELVETGRRDWS